MDISGASGIIIVCYMLIPILLVLLVAFLAGTIITISLLKIRARKIAIKLAEAKAWAAAHRADGTPYPPAGRGICERCSGAFDKVYFLPGGERLCPACYDIVVPCPAPCDTQPSLQEQP